MNVGKAPGADEIPADLLKCDKFLLPHLYGLLCTSWRNGKFPTAIKDAKIVTLDNFMADSLVPNNYKCNHPYRGYPFSFKT